MATIANKTLQNDPNQPQQQQAAGPSTPGPTTGPSAPAQQKASSGRFTNVQSYLNANKGAGQKIANVVGQNVQKDVGSVSKQVSDEASKISSNIGAEKERLAKASGFQQQIGAQGEGAQAITSDAAKLAEFQKLYTNQNIAQQQQQDLNQQAAAAQTAIQTAQQNVNALGTEAGRMAALQRALQRPAYTQGQRTLDQLMFQVGGAKQVADQRGQFGQQLTGLQKTQDTQAQALASQLAANKQAEIDAEKNLRGAVTGATGAFEQAQTLEAINKNAENARQNALFQQYILGNTGNISDADKQLINERLGIKNSADVKTYGVTRGDAYKNYLQQGRTDLATGDVIAADDLSRFNALAQLGGTQSKYVQAGNEGPASGLKMDTLRADAAAARENLLKDLAAQNNLRVGTSTGNYYGSGRVGEINYGGSGFLKNILESAEQNRAGNVGANVIGATDLGFAPSSYGFGAQLVDRADIRDRQGLQQIGAVSQGGGANSYAGGVSGQGLAIDANGNLVASNPNESFDFQRNVNVANQEAAGSVQRYLDNLLNQSRYFDTLGSSNEATGTIFGSNKQVGTDTFSRLLADLSKGK